MTKNSYGIYQFEQFATIPNLIHGFSTRHLGDVKREHNTFDSSLEKVAESLFIAKTQILCMEQEHSPHVANVTKNDLGSFVARTDGMTTKDADLFLCVRTGDCVPVLLFDPEKQICGVAHAGWGGALLNIVSVLVDKMEELGADRKNIRAGIGPAIRVCCYNIKEDRKELFLTLYSEYQIIEQRNDIFYLNLPELTKQQLLASGITEMHIADSEICTKDASDEFYSFRQKDKQFGLFAGIIGWKST